VVMMHSSTKVTKRANNVLLLDLIQKSINQQGQKWQLFFFTSGLVKLHFLCCCNDEKVWACMQSKFISIFFYFHIIFTFVNYHSNKLKTYQAGLGIKGIRTWRSQSPRLLVFLILKMLLSRFSIREARLWRHKN
jgi:hypothetical protein